MCRARCMEKKQERRRRRKEGLRRRKEEGKEWVAEVKELVKEWRRRIRHRQLVELVRVEWKVAKMECRVKRKQRSRRNRE